MSFIDQAETAIKLAAFDIGLRELARRADVPEATARRLIKTNHEAVMNLKRLEGAALRYQAEKEAAA